MRSRIVMLSLAASAAMALTTAANAQSNGECWRHSPATGWSRCSSIDSRRERDDRARAIAERARERASVLVERRAESRALSRARSEAARFRAQDNAWKERERTRVRAERAQMRSESRALKYRYRYDRR